MIRRVVALAVLCFLALAGAHAGEKPKPFRLIDGFTLKLPSSNSMTCTIEEARGRPGMAARIRYKIPNEKGTAQVKLPDLARQIEVKGSFKIKAWVKGDNSANEISISITHAQAGFDHRGTYRIYGHREINLGWRKLDFDGWKQFGFSVDEKQIPNERAVWFSHVSVRRPKGGTKAEGDIMLDDLRLFPDATRETGFASLRLLGSNTRTYSQDLKFLLQMSYFGTEPIAVEVSITMTDANDNTVARRDFDEIPLGVGDAREVVLELVLENLQLFLPPFKIQGEVFSREEPSFKGDMRTTLVMSNSKLLFDDFSNVFGRWITSGLQPNLGENHAIYGEQQRAMATTQTNTRISRVEIDPAGAPKSSTPPGRFAMRIDYSGPSAVYNGIRRYFPGDAYRMGVWVRGDGSGAALHAIIMDFAGPGSTSYTWNHTWNAPKICDLNFKGWRYIEVPLPGNGIGPRSMRGGTQGAVDFPLSIPAFIITPARGKPAGSIQIGAIYLETQQPRADALSVQVGYDDVNHEYAPKHKAWVTVQNGWRPSGRSVNARWMLLDRGNGVIAKGRRAFDLKPTGLFTFPIDMAPYADEIAKRSGPLRLEVTAEDRQEAASARATIILAKPESDALITDFEVDRGYVGLPANGVNPQPPTGQPIARTTTDQKTSGSRSLAVPWQKGELRPIAVDPPMQGIPTEISMQVFGDKSNVLFYPIIGDRFGVISGVDSNRWDLFLPRTMSGPLQNAVKVDWQGWKKLTFRLPPIPETWDDKRVRAFLPTYPYGVHLAVAARGDVAADSGTLYVDDIRVKTHIEPDARLAMRLQRLGETNIVPPGSAVRVVVSNWAASGQPREAVVSGGLYDWHGRRTAGIDKPVKLGPGKSQTVVIAEKMATGAYQLKIELKQGKGDKEKTLSLISEDLLVMDPGTVLGPQWRQALTDPTKLRIPLKDRYKFVNFDWDWSEFLPGNLEVETLLACVYSIKNAHRDPYVLLGYSTYWACGEGMEDLLSDRLSARTGYAPGGRNWGHSVDIFHVPDRMDDWENYVREMMRSVGKEVSGFILWDMPDSKDYRFLGVPPAKFAEMITLVDKWRKRYCPDTPLIIGGLSRSSALDYLVDVKKELWNITREDVWRQKLKSLGKTEEELTSLTPEENAWIEAELKTIQEDTSDKPAEEGKEERAEKPDTKQSREDLEEEREEMRDELRKQKLAKLKSAALDELEPEKIAELKKQTADRFDGANIRIDGGRISPEDGQIVEYIADLQNILQSGADKKKIVILTDLDWAVEKATGGLDAFDQAAYLARATLLLDRVGVHPTLFLHNVDMVRENFGLTYKKVLTIPPVIQKLPAFQFKPAWWCMVRIKDFLDNTDPVAEIPVQDVIPGRTRCLLYQNKKDRKHVAVMWRNAGEGEISFSGTGMTVEFVEDVLGARIDPKDGWYEIGKMPAVFVLGPSSRPVADALACLRVREADQKMFWPQDVIAAFTHTAGKQDYKQAGGKETVFAGRTSDGRRESWRGLEFLDNGTESFTVDVPPGAGLVLQKRFFLGDSFERDEEGRAKETDDPHRHGQQAEVIVNGKRVGTWDLTRSQKRMPGGLREAAYVIDKSALNGKKRATVELRYKGVANTAGWIVCAYAGGEFPLSAFKPIHTRSAVTLPRIGRNVVGLKMKIDKKSYDNGIGVFAPCIIEYPLNGQFKKFTAEVGVDAATQGRGTVVFEVKGDGRLLWSSPVVSGLDKAKSVDVDVKGINRLQLSVTDGGDGNKLDAADWGNAALHY